MSDAVYIRLSVRDKKSVKQIDIENKGSVIVDFDADGNIIGLEILSLICEIKEDGREMSLCAKDSYESWY